MAEHHFHLKANWPGSRNDIGEIEVGNLVTKNFHSTRRCPQTKWTKPKYGKFQLNLNTTTISFDQAGHEYRLSPAIVLLWDLDLI